MSQQPPKVEEILKQAGLLEEVMQKHDILTGIVKVVNSQGNMDRDTVICRLAMTIYHSRRLTKQSLITGLDDPGAIYLRAANNPKLKALLDDTAVRYKTIASMELVRTLMCFLIAAYIVEIAS